MTTYLEPPDCKAFQRAHGPEFYPCRSCGQTGVRRIEVDLVSLLIELGVLKQEVRDEEQNATR
jgi:hypothetical protein